MKVLIFVLFLIFAPSVLVLFGALLGGAAVWIAGGVSIALIIAGILKLVKIIKLSKLKPIYDEQLRKLGPKAQFFAEVKPLLKKEYDGAEQKQKIRGEIKDIAIKYGLDPENTSYRSIYQEGARIILEAQEKYILQQDKGNSMLFFMCLSKRHGSGSIAEATESTNTYTIIKYAKKYSVVDLSGYSGTYSSPKLSDEDKLAIVNAYNKGHDALGKYTQMIPYYHEWLCIEYDDNGSHNYEKFYILDN